MYEDCAYLQVDVRDVSTIDVECNQVDVVIRVAEGEVNLVGEVDHRGQSRDQGQRHPARDRALHRPASLPASVSSASKRGIAQPRLLGAVAEAVDGRLRRDATTSATTPGGGPTSRSATRSART